jgi:hypothetical protein
LFSNQYWFYKDLFFSVFTIINKENKVSVKYKTKNIKTEGKEVFLAKINQTRANMISSRNLRPNETKVNSVWFSGSLVCPFKKITSVTRDITEKQNESKGISLNDIAIPENENIRSPVPLIIAFSIRSGTKNLKTGFNLKAGYLIKSFTTV